MNETQRKPRNYKLFVSGSFDIPFLAITIGLLTIGLIMLFSASYPYSYQYEDNSYHYIMRQGLWAVIGLVAMFLVSKIDYHILRLFAWPLYGVTIALLGLVLVMPEVVPGFKRWIKIGPITFQPSDIAKFALILIFAHLISLNIKRMKEFRFDVLFLGVLLAAVCGLVIAGNHVSGTLLIAMIGLVMMYVGGTKRKYFIIGIGAMVVVVAAVFLVPSFMDYAGERITAWIDKDYDPTGARWQTNNSLYAIGSGGLLGTGLGNSKQKYLYVSEPHNDFIFAIVCEELGFVGATLILAGYMFLIWRGFVISTKAPDKFGSLLVVGIVAQVGIQTLLNVAVVTDTMPNTGIALPFFSYGGTALMMLLFQMGVVLSVSRQANLKKV